MLPPQRKPLRWGLFYCLAGVLYSIIFSVGEVKRMDEFWKERIEATKLLIVAYEDALIALNSGVISYSINTSQSQQSVTRASIPDIKRTIDSLTNSLVTYQARLTGNGVTRVIPGW